MRTQTVKIGGKEIVIRESLIKDIKNNIIPKIGSAWKEISKGEISEIADRLSGQIKEVFPELQGVDIDECYPSEIEAFIKAWIECNFFGLKNVLAPVLSLIVKGQQPQGLDLAGLLDNQTTGKS
jgi:hypothetical protein